MQATDTPPDTFQSGAVRVPEVTLNGQALDLTSYARRDKIDLNDFYPALLRAWTHRGKLVAFNDTWDTTVMFVNRDLFRRAGLQVPGASLTYDQWLDLSKKLTVPDDERTVWGGFHSTNLPNVFNAVWAWGAEVFSADSRRCLLDSPVATDAIQWIADMWGKHNAAPPPSYTGVPGQGWTMLLPAGRLASGMDANGTSTSRTFMQAANLDWYVVPIPKGPKARANWQFANTTHVAGNSKNLEGAWAWLSFMSSAEGYDARGPVETSRSVHPSKANSPRLTTQPWLAERGVIQAWRDSEATLHEPPHVPNYQAVTAEINRAFGSVWNGQRTAKQAMAEVVSVANAMLPQT